LLLRWVNTRYSSFIRETYIKPSKSIELGT
jgi:hypothetical protein